ncbi:hypothetical protein E2320_004968 [Naja naja]|nr:hypothetical protein E2320_004968 [Naja naja]
MSPSDHSGQPLAAAELDPAQAHEEEEEPPNPEDADCSPGQLPPAPAEEAGHPKTYCQAWLLAPLEDARFLICCTNWY